MSDINHLGCIKKIYHNKKIAMAPSNLFLLVILALLLWLLITLSYEFITIENTKDYSYRVKCMLKIMSLCLVVLAMCICLTTMYIINEDEDSSMIGLDRSNSVLRYSSGYVSNDDYKNLYNKQQDFSKNRIELEDLKTLYDREDEEEEEEELEFPFSTSNLKSYSV